MPVRVDVTDFSYIHLLFIPILRYEAPCAILLIDAWADQAAIAAHHASPMMAIIVALREKYDLHMTVERYVSAEENAEDERFIRK